MGVKLYYSLICKSKFVIGNSSSGVIEVPYFDKLSINIGSRQEGREKDENVIDVKPEKSNINNTINEVLSGKIKAKKCNKLFGNGNSSKIIYKTIKEKLFDSI